jgi:cytochrome c-type biogenesis protein CcmH
MIRLLVVLLLVANAGFAAEPESGFDDPVLEQRYWNLIREIRCPKCLNESIADSDAPVAADLRREVRRLVASGATDEQVTEFMMNRYGDFVLYRPRLTPATLALWAGPFLFLAVGSLVFYRILRVRRTQSLDEDTPA